MTEKMIKDLQRFEWLMVHVNTNREDIDRKMKKYEESCPDIGQNDEIVIDIFKRILELNPNQEIKKLCEHHIHMYMKLAEHREDEDYLYEEEGKGKLDKYQILKQIHQDIASKVYLEIGVHKGRSFNLAQCTAIGVDPFPNIVPKSNQTIHTETSDNFFSRGVTIKPDLVFIDGLHLFEQALMDFINSERICHRDSVIVMDDIFPVHPSQALRERHTTRWTGDVWKVYEILKEYRPDLVLQPLDAYPTGLLVVSNLFPESTCLLSNYKGIIEKYMDLPVPVSILNRDVLCDECGGDGIIDSGGVTPWGAGIDIPCPKCRRDEEDYS